MWHTCALFCLPHCDLYEKVCFAFVCALKVMCLCVGKHLNVCVSVRLHSLCACERPMISPSCIVELQYWPFPDYFIFVYLFIFPSFCLPSCILCIYPPSLYPFILFTFPPSLSCPSVIFPFCSRSLSFDQHRERRLSLQRLVSTGLL